MASPKLTDEQKAQVAQWVAEGAHLNQIQDRLKDDLGITLTFMETRFLISDLGLELQPSSADAGQAGDKEAGTLIGEEKSEEWAAETTDGSFSPTAEPPSSLGAPAGAGSAKVVLDELAVPGALVSGKVTFSDGQTATWYLDQLGRLGLGGVDRAYKPPPADMPAFQRELQTLLQRAGY
ncbi:MAG: hypothetical protein ACR2OZ_01365 [Verrucomicrobiales bacterium]